MASLYASQSRMSAQQRSRSSSLASLDERAKKKRSSTSSRSSSTSSLHSLDILSPGTNAACTDDVSEHSALMQSQDAIPNGNAVPAGGGGGDSVVWLTPSSGSPATPQYGHHTGYPSVDSPKRPHSTPIKHLTITELSHVQELSRSPSPAEDIASIMEHNFATSTPKANSDAALHTARPNVLSSNELSTELSDATVITHDFMASCRTSDSAASPETPTDHEYSVPIVGYEVMEERSRFTVFKIHVYRTREENWFIFRRYSDFVRLNDRLTELYPHFRLALPPKKWFGDNFEQVFLEERMEGLRSFCKNIVSHRDVSQSIPVREFFCLDDPPGPHESLEESRAVCDQLEEHVYSLRRLGQEKDARITLLEEELALHKAEIENLRKSLRLERAMNAGRLRERKSPSQSSQRSESSLPEQDQASLRTEAEPVMMCSKTSSPDEAMAQLTNHILHTAMVHSCLGDTIEGTTGLPEKMASVEGNNNSQLQSPEGSMEPHLLEFRLGGDSPSPPVFST